MNNIAEYSVVIELLSIALDLGIFQLVVKLDSELVVSQLNYVYSILNHILFRKYWRFHLLERSFDYISYEHIPKEINTLTNYVLNWNLPH